MQKRYIRNHCFKSVYLGSICTFVLGPDYFGLDDRDIGLSPDQEHEKGATPVLRPWHTSCHREGCQGCESKLCETGKKPPVSSIKRVGSLLISASNNGTVRCWDVFSGCCLRCVVCCIWALYLCGLLYVIVARVVCLFFCLVDVAFLF